MSRSGTPAGLEEKLAMISRAQVAATGQAVGRFATFLEGRIGANIPRRTGALAGTLHQVSTSTTHRTTIEILAGGHAAPYALGVEFRDPHEDQAHADEATPEGHPGAGFFRRPIDMHRRALAPQVAASVQAAR